MNRYLEIATKNEHVYAIFCQPEVAGDVISGGNVKTIEGKLAVNFEVASFNSFRDIKTRRPTNWWGSAKRDITYPTAVPLRRVRFLAKGYEHPSVVSFPMIWHNWTKRPIDYESQFPKQ